MAASFDDKSHVGMARCFYCGEFDQILLNRHLAKTLPRDCGVINMEPCHKCADLMKAGVILIAVDPASMDGVEADQREWRAKMAVSDERSRRNARPFIPNPSRTGGWFVLRDAAIRRIFNPPALVDQILRLRWSFIGEDAARQLGLYEQQAVYKTAEDAIASESTGTPGS